MRNLIKKTNARSRSYPSIFNDLFLTENIRNTSFKRQFPPVNIKDGDKTYTLELALPGYKKEDLSIKLDKNILIISSENNEKSEEKLDTYTRREFSPTSFSRSFTLPESVDIENIDASTVQGILILTLPKKEEALKNKVKHISIK
tara:strand:+ start:2079 stop:2513 length:435 start_codon:yes stop_codon:yes gene_type:complete